MNRFEQALEQSTGRSMEYLRNTPLDEQRLAVEQERGKPMAYKSYFPLIGRGSVLRDRMVSHEEVEKRFLAALRA